MGYDLEFREQDIVADAVLTLRFYIFVAKSRHA